MFVKRLDIQFIQHQELKQQFSCKLNVVSINSVFFCSKLSKNQKKSLSLLHSKVWILYDFIKPNKKLKYGIVPHIDFEFFGPGLLVSRVAHLFSLKILLLIKLLIFLFSLLNTHSMQMNFGFLVIDFNYYNNKK